MITHTQLTLAEVFENCQNKFDNDKYQFLSLLDEAINLDEIVVFCVIPSLFAIIKLFQLHIHFLSPVFVLKSMNTFFHLSPFSPPYTEIFI